MSEKTPYWQARADNLAMALTDELCNHHRVVDPRDASSLADALANDLPAVYRAAPALLEALELLLDDVDGESTPAIRAAETAIVKARGTDG